MSETLIIALISLASGIIGALIVGIPVWKRLSSDTKKTEAEIDSIAVKTMKEALESVDNRLHTVESDMEKKITEAACLTVERDELKEQVEELRKEVEALRIEVEALRAENKSLKDVLQKRRKPAEKP